MGFSFSPVTFFSIPKVTGAVNGTSLDASGNVVLGGDINTSDGQLTSNRDVLGNSHQIRLVEGSLRIRDTTPGLTADIFAVTPNNQLTNAGGVNSVIGGSPTWKIASGAGNIDVLAFNGPWNPSGGTSTFSFLHYYGIDEGVSGGAHVMANFNVTIVQNGASTETVRGVYYHPNVIALFGAHIAWENTTGDVLLGSTSGKVGINQPAPAAKVDIGASDGTNGDVPLLFQPGTLTGAGVNGAFEYDGSHLYFTIGGVRTMVV